MLKIYADPITINSRKVIAGLDFMGAPFELIKLDFLTGEFKNPDYAKLNPMVQLPTAVDGDFVLSQSNAILQYAADKIGNVDAYPKDLQQRADVNRWMFWEATAMHNICYIYLHEHAVKLLMGEQADAAVLEDTDPKFHKLATVLDQHLAEREWLCGSAPTIADISVASAMHLHTLTKFPLSEYDHINRWMQENIEQLPSWKKTHVSLGDSGVVSAYPTE